MIDRPQPTALSPEATAPEPALRGGVVSVADAGQGGEGQKRVAECQKGVAGDDHMGLRVGAARLVMSGAASAWIADWTEKEAATP